MCQHRMAGLAAIEIAQKVSKIWRSLQAEWKYSNRSSSKNGKRARRKDRINIASQNRGGAGCSTSSSSDTSSYGITEERSSGHPKMSWQDVYTLAVKWRQISEPCDPVVWVNKLRYGISKCCHLLPFGVSFFLSFFLIIVIYLSLLFFKVHLPWIFLLYHFC